MTLAFGQVRGAGTVHFRPVFHRLRRSKCRLPAAPYTRKKTSPGTHLGNKHIVPYALYAAKTYISPVFAERTGFTDDDLKLFSKPFSRCSLMTSPRPCRDERARYLRLLSMSARRTETMLSRTSARPGSAVTTPTSYSPLSNPRFARQKPSGEFEDYHVIDEGRTRKRRLCCSRSPPSSSRGPQRLR